MELSIMALSIITTSLITLPAKYLKRFTRLLTTFALTLLTCSTVFAGPAAKIDDLSWMTGTWTVALGPNTLEENWVSAGGGSIAAMIRMSGDGKTSMFEVITIEEKDGSLEMHVQQWGPGFSPLSAEAQTLELIEIEDNRVKFKAVTEGSMTSLQYSRQTPDTFSIDMQTSDGRSVQVTLDAR